MTRIHMDLTPESAGKLLRGMAERTAASNRDWDKFEVIATQFFGDAYKAGLAASSVCEANRD